MSMVQQNWNAEPSTILCVDDDTYLAELLVFALSRAGYKVFAAANGTRALEIAHTEPIDLAILDVGLPDTSGLHLCAQLRKTLHIPVILLTARHSDQDILSGFGEGADDYVCKPFTMQVLLYRLRAVLRRAAPAFAARTLVENTASPTEGYFNAEYNELQGIGGCVKLTPTEGKILQLLIMNEGHTLSPERILDRLWSTDSESCVSVIKTHIRRLRNKLALAFGDVQIIHTVPGVGYSIRQWPRRQVVGAELALRETFR